VSIDLYMARVASMTASTSSGWNATGWNIADDDDPGAAGVREPRRRPPRPSKGGAAADPKEAVRA